MTDADVSQMYASSEHDDSVYVSRAAVWAACCSRSLLGCVRQRRPLQSLIAPMHACTRTQRTIRSSYLAACSLRHTRATSAV